VTATAHEFAAVIGAIDALRGEVAILAAKFDKLVMEVKAIKAVVGQDARER
jgi:hypothetical protein